MQGFQSSPVPRETGSPLGKVSGRAEVRIGWLTLKQKSFQSSVRGLPYLQTQPAQVGVAAADRCGPAPMGECA